MANGNKTSKLLNILIFQRRFLSASYLFCNSLTACEYGLLQIYKSLLNDP